MWVLAVAGLVALGCGVLAYRGVAKGVTLNAFPTPYLFFGIAWWGGAGVLAAIGLALSADGRAALSLLALVPALCCFIIALLSFFWLPTALRPGWFRDWQDDQRRRQDLQQGGVAPRWRRGSADD